MHLNNYLFAVPSRSRRLIFTHISKFSISALVILHSVHEMTASSRCSKDSQINLCTFLESDVSLCSVGFTNSPFSFTKFTFASVFPSLYALWSAFPNQNDCIKELCDSCFNKNSPLFPHDIPLFSCGYRRPGYHSRGRGGSKGPWKWGPVAPPDDNWRGRVVQSWIKITSG